MRRDRFLRKAGGLGSLLLGLALAQFFVAGVALAQQTGGIRGKLTDAASGQPIDGVVVIATSPVLQGEELAVSEADGRFEFALLPPGAYQLRFDADGYRSQVIEGVEVALGRNTPVTLDLAPTTIQAEEIQVVVAPPTVDRGATDTRTALTQEFIQKTPSARTFTAVLEEAPGASEDALGVQVMGATSVENSYVIDGLNVTDISDGSSGSTMNTDFFDRLEMQTAGYLPEFGRSTGGIFNLVLKQGSNDFHGSVFANFRPGFLRASQKQVGRVGDSLQSETNLLLDMDVGFSLGGPIIKDKLWFFVAMNPQITWADYHRTARRATSWEDGSGNPLTFEDAETKTFSSRFETYMYAGKLTYAVNDNNRVNFAYFATPSKSTGVSISPAVGQETVFDQPTRSGAHNLTLNYSSQLFDGAFQIEGFLGAHFRDDDELNEPNIPAVQTRYLQGLENYEVTDCVEDPNTTYAVLDDQGKPVLDAGGQPVRADAIDCPVSRYVAGGPGYWEDIQLTRYSGGLKFTNLFAGHRIRYGLDYEYRKFTSQRGYTGGYFEQRYSPTTHRRRFFASEGGPNADVEGVNIYPEFEATVKTHALSAFAQDQWEINKYLSVNGGLRWDMEKFNGTEGTAFSIKDMFAPRVGVAVDPTGEGRSRVFANWGWYYESIPMTITQRAFSREGSTYTFVDGNGTTLCHPNLLDENGQPLFEDINGNGKLDFDDVNGDGVQDRLTERSDRRFAPVPNGQAFENGVQAIVGTNCSHYPYGVLGGTDEPVVNNLKGQYHQEFMLGAEYALTRDWSVGVTGIYRNLERVVEDISADDGNTYVIANPGVNDCDVGENERASLATVCSDADGNYDKNKTLFDEPTRRYLGLIFKAEKRMSDHYQLLASYTLSRTRGDYPGLFAQDTGQLDPNLSSQFDLLSLMPNRKGLLPTDRTHVIKVTGSYDLVGLNEALKGLSAGASYQGRSGIPISYLGSHPVYGASEAFILPRGAAGRTPFHHDVDLTFNYDLPLGGDMMLNFNATLFNVLNTQEVLRVDQEFTQDDVDPQDPNAVGPSDLETVLVTDTRRVDLNMDGTIDDLDVDANGNPVTEEYQRPLEKNASFKRALEYQAPFGVRLGVRLTF